jgi:hypothetical protein
VIGVAAGTKVFLACRPVDLRNGFDGLASKAQQVIGADPFSGHLFLFRGKRGDYLKALCWDGSGVCQTIREGSFRLAADRGWGNDADAGAVGAADRGDGLAQDDSTASAGAANAGLTRQRFYFDSSPHLADLLG